MQFIQYELPNSDWIHFELKNIDSVSFNPVMHDRRGKLCLRSGSIHLDKSAEGFTIIEKLTNQKSSQQSIHIEGSIITGQVAQANGSIFMSQTQGNNKVYHFYTSDDIASIQISIEPGINVIVWVDNTKVYVDQTLLSKFYLSPTNENKGLWQILNVSEQSKDLETRTGKQESSQLNNYIQELYQSINETSNERAKEIVNKIIALVQHSEMPAVEIETALVYLRVVSLETKREVLDKVFIAQFMNSAIEVTKNYLLSVKK